MKDKLALGSRYLLGLIFVVFGLNGFLQFIPMPPPPPAAGAFLGALAGTGYFFPFLKITEIAIGVLFLANKFVPLALIILAPITINIVLYHVFLDPSAQGLMLPIVITLLQIVLAKANWSKFSGVLSK